MIAIYLKMLTFAQCYKESDCTFNNLELPLLSSKNSAKSIISLFIVQITWSAEACPPPALVQDPWFCDLNHPTLFSWPQLPDQPSPLWSVLISVQVGSQAGLNDWWSCLSMVVLEGQTSFSAEATGSTCHPHFKGCYCSVHICSAIVWVNKGLWSLVEEVVTKTVLLQALSNHRRLRDDLFCL